MIGAPITPYNRGVKRGNPMSPAFFNSIINYVTDNMQGNINVHINNSNNSNINVYKIICKRYMAYCTISHIAFADDLALFTKECNDAKSS